jgi:hypothetical protein
MKIQVLPRAPERITTTWEGVSRERVQQWCLLEIDGLPTSFQITNDPGKELPPGEYELDAKSFSVTNGRLQVTRVVLRPLSPSSRQSSKAA